MASARIAESLPPNIDLTRSEIAFGDRALPKLNRELLGSDLLLKQRALRSLCDLSHSPQNVTRALQEGIPNSLRDLLKDSDDTIRLKAAEALFLFTGHANGRKALLDCNLVKPVAAVFDDKVEAVRRNAHSVLERATRNVAANVAAVVEANLIPVLVNKICTEHHEIQGIALDTLHNCLQYNVAAGLDANAMSLLSNLLPHPITAVSEKLIRSIMDLSFDPKGKEQAVALGVVEKIVPMLRDPHASVRAASVGAIMSVAITTEGKQAAVAAGAVDSIMDCLHDTDEGILLNTLKAVAIIADHPSARQQLKASLPKIRELEGFVGTRMDPTAISRSAKLAVQRIEWQA